MAVGDVDGDGDLDLLVVNTDSHTIIVCYNGDNATGTNTGTFTSRSSVAVGQYPADIALGDLDGDGDLDLLACNSGSATVSVRLNGGDASGSNTGYFSNGTAVPVGSDPLRVALADADGDGDLDLFTTSGARYAMSVRLNGGNDAGAGSGTFSNGSDIPAAHASELALGDVDGDGDLDIVTTNYDSNTLSVHVNRPLLPSITSVTPAANARSVDRNSPVTVSCSAPLTADAIPALKVYSAQRGGLRTRGATPAVVSGSMLTFAPASAFMPGETVSATVGSAAVSGSNLTFGKVVQFTAAAAGTGKGNFRPGTLVTTSEIPYKTALADVDGDGDLDMFVLNRTRKSVSVRLNGGDATGSNRGVFSNGYNISVGPAGGGDAFGRLYDLALGDVDGDGDIDLVTANGLDHTVSVRFNKGGVEGFSAGYEVPLGIGVIDGVVLGDVDGDGDLDVFVLAGSSTRVMILLNGGNSTGSNTGRFVWHDEVTNVTSTGVKKCLVGDVDGDGDLDFLTLATSQVRVHLNEANNTGVAAGGFYTGPSVYFSNYDPSDMALGDVDADNDLDLVLISVLDAGGIKVLLNGGNNSGSNTGVFSIGPTFSDRSAYTIALSDVDADGDLDIVFPKSSFRADYKVCVYLNGNDATGSSTGIFSDIHEYSLPGFTRHLALGDVDGDGDVDVVAASQTSSDGGGASVQLNESTALATTKSASASSGGLIVVPTIGTGEAPRYSFTGSALTTGTTLAIFSLTGQRVWQQKAEVAATGVLPIAGLASGCYLVQLQTDSGTFVARFFLP